MLAQQLQDMWPTPIIIICQNQPLLILLHKVSMTQLLGTTMEKITPNSRPYNFLLCHVAMKKTSFSVNYYSAPGASFLSRIPGTPGAKTKEG